MLLGGAGTALTASSTVPASTADYAQTRVVGGTMQQISFVYAAGRATSFVVRITGSLALNTVTASYEGGGALVCVPGALVGPLLTGYTPVTCTGVAPETGTPTVTITIS